MKNGIRKLEQSEVDANIKKFNKNVITKKLAKLLLNTYLCFDDVSKIIRYIENAKNLSDRELMDMLNQYYQLGSTNNDKIVTLKNKYREAITIKS